MSERGCADVCGRCGRKGTVGHGWGEGPRHERAWMRGRVWTRKPESQKAKKKESQKSQKARKPESQKGGKPKSQKASKKASQEARRPEGQKARRPEGQRENGS